MLISYNQIETVLWNITDNLLENQRQGKVVTNLLEQVAQINTSVVTLYDQLFEFTAQSNPLDLFFKTMMCGTENGITPFYKANPSIACKFTDSFIVVDVS